MRNDLKKNFNILINKIDVNQSNINNIKNDLDKASTSTFYTEYEDIYKKESQGFLSKINQLSKDIIITKKSSNKNNLNLKKELNINKINKNKTTNNYSNNTSKINNNKANNICANNSNINIEEKNYF